VDAALDAQHKLRNQKLGEMLLVKQLISPDELEARSRNRRACRWCASARR
jgi:hypothetical protein